MKGRISPALERVLQQRRARARSETMEQTMEARFPPMTPEEVAEEIRHLENVWALHDRYLRRGTTIEHQHTRAMLQLAAAEAERDRLAAALEEIVASEWGCDCVCEWSRIARAAIHPKQEPSDER